MTTSENRRKMWAVGTTAFYVALIAIVYTSLRSEMQSGREETVTNRGIGSQIRDESTAIKTAQQDQGRISRENNAMLKEILRRSP